MKVFHVKKQLAALFMPGFLIGIIYVNFLAKKYVAAPDLFSEYFLDQFRGVQIDEKFMVSASHSLRSVFYAFRVGSYEVEKSKRRVISWVDRHICGGACFAGGIELGNERLSLVSYRCFSTVSFLYSCVFYDPEILL